MSQLPADRRDPLVDRLGPGHPHHDRIVGLHRAAMVAGDPGYLDPMSGAFVFTAQSLWDRDGCCASGCRHCPYDEGPRPGTTG